MVFIHFEAVLELEGSQVISWTHIFSLLKDEINECIFPRKFNSKHYNDFSYRSYKTYQCDSISSRASSQITCTVFLIVTSTTSASAIWKVSMHFRFVKRSFICRWHALFVKSIILSMLTVNEEYHYFRMVSLVQ